MKVDIPVGDLRKIIKKSIDKAYEEIYSIIPNYRSQKGSDYIEKSSKYIELGLKNYDPNKIEEEVIEAPVIEKVEVKEEKPAKKTRRKRTSKKK